MAAKKTVLALLLLIVATHGLYAQNRPFPYKLKKWDLILIPASFGLSEFGESQAEKKGHISLEEIRALDRNDVIGFDRGATYHYSFDWDERSDQYRDIVTVSSLLLMSIPPLFHAKFSDIGTIAVMLGESILLLKGVTFLTKAAVGRKRPYLYNTDVSAEQRHAFSDSPYLSFFSGHTCAAFLAATFASKVITDIHGDSIWTKLLWGSSLSLATMAGYARYKAGMHYPSDVIVGAAVGFAIGYFIPILHKKNRRDRLSLIIAPNRIGFRLAL